MNYQEKILLEIKKKLAPGENLAQLIAQALDVSMDAAYRRCRLDANLTIDETAKLCQHFQLSPETLFNMDGKFLRFTYQPATELGENLESYLLELNQNLQQLRKLSNAQLMFTVNNTPFLQLLNFPHLLRAKLFFWAKNHLHHEGYHSEKLRKSDFSSLDQEVIAACLENYNAIPSTEIYDNQLLLGFAQEIVNNYLMGNIAHKGYVQFLFNQLFDMVNHLEKQAEFGRKMSVNAKPYEIAAELTVLNNPALNAIAIFQYTSKEQSGVFLAHNYLNSMHTQDAAYFTETNSILNAIASHSSVISKNNTLERKKYFESARRQLNQIKQQL